MTLQLRRLGPTIQIERLPFLERGSFEWTAGRGSGCHIFVKSKYASRKHFSIIHKDKSFFLYDHGTLNGTYLNDEKLLPLKEYPLLLGSTISVGVLPSLINENDCAIFIFELCQEHDKKEEEKCVTISDNSKQNSEKGVNHFVSEKETNEAGRTSEEDKEKESDGTTNMKPGSSEMLQTTVEVEDTLHCNIRLQVKIEKVQEPLSEDEPKSYSSDNEAQRTEKSKRNIESDPENDERCRRDDVAVKKENPELNNDAFKSDINCVPKVEVMEMDLDEPEGFDDSKSKNSEYEDSIEIDETEIKYSQSYSMAEELIEISDSEGEIKTTVKTEPDIDDFNTVKLEQDDGYEYDDVVFLDSIIRVQNEDYPEVIIDDNELTETDKKWMGKLLKAREQIDNSDQTTKENSRDTTVSAETEIEPVITSVDFTEKKFWKDDKVRADQNERMNPTRSSFRRKRRREHRVDATEKTDNDEKRKIAENLTLSQDKLKDSLVERVSLPVEKRPPSTVPESKPYREKPKKMKIFNFLQNDDDRRNNFKPSRKKRRRDTSGPTENLNGSDSIKKRAVTIFDKTSPVQVNPKKKQKKYTNVLSSFEKERIKFQRKQRLKEISMRGAARDGNKEMMPKLSPPLKVKITHQNRSEFLCTDIIAKDVTAKAYTPPKKSDQKDRITSELKPLNDNAFHLNRANDAVEKVSKNLEENLFQENIPRRESYTKIHTVVTEKSRVLKSCLKKCGYTFMKSNRPIVPQKSVMFALTCPQNVRYYETENKIMRKTSSLSQNKQLLTSSDPKELRRFRSIVFEICNWNAIWLEESKKAATFELPPSFEISSLKSLQKKFPNHGDYVGSFIPLLLLDLWSVICEKWKLHGSTLSRCTARCTGYDAHTEMKENKLGVLKCEIVEHVSNKIFLLLKEGDLVVIQLEKTLGSTESGSRDGGSVKRLFYRIFGYVQKKTVEVLDQGSIRTTSDYGCSDVGKLTVMKLSILVKLRTELPVYVGHSVQITLLHHIGPKLVMCEAVHNLHMSPLCNVILKPSRSEMTFSAPVRNENVAFKGLLDESQRELIFKLLSSCFNQNTSLLQVQGGAGTGKTQAIMAFILQVLCSPLWKGSGVPKVLYCSHSNVVVDKMALNLKIYRQSLKPSSRYKLVRYGTLNSIMPEVRDISSYMLTVQNEHKANVAVKIKFFDAKIQELAKDLENCDKFGKKEIEEKSSKLNEYVKNREAVKNSRPMLGEQKPSHEAESIILENADVICTTCSASGTSKLLRVFEKIKSKTPEKKIICIIDDAMRCNESETIIPLQLGVTHLILVGDSQQCRPLATNAISQKFGVDQSLFWRILSSYDKTRNISPVYTLKTQFRMSPGISDIVNKIFYQEKLRNGYCNITPWNIQEFLFLRDTEVTEEECELRMQNIAESITSELLDIFSAESYNCSIGIITCRFDLAKTLNTKFNYRFAESNSSRIEINSVENVQGTEFDIVLFLYDAKMQCSSKTLMAMTRARRSLLIITSFPPNRNNKLLNKIAEEAETRRVLHSIDKKMRGSQLERIIKKLIT